MAAKTPVKAIFTGSDVTSLGEYTSSDTVAVANLGTGIPSSSNYLRGDGAWTAISDNDTTYTAGAGVTLTATEFTVDLNTDLGVTSTAAELNILDGVTSTAAELNILDGVTSTAAELNILDGVTSTAAELNILDGVTSTAAELNILDGVTATAAELNYTDGVTSAIQTQLGTKLNTGGTLATATINTLTSTTTTATTANITTVDLGNWTVTESTGVLYFATGGTNKMKLDSSGDLTVVGNITAYGTV